LPLIWPITINSKKTSEEIKLASLDHWIFLGQFLSFLRQKLGIRF
jgi:hypothetical protein